MFVRDARRMLLSAGILLCAVRGTHARAQFIEGPNVNAPKEETSAVTPRVLSPAEMPPNPPKVTCAGDTLTINAENATLLSILSAVRSCIGVAIDLPDGAGAVRVYTSVGPGPAHEILQSLLSSTDLDYVIQASDSSPAKIQAIMLMARVKDSKEVAPPTGQTLSATRRAWQEARRNARPQRSESIAANIGEDDAEVARAIEEPASAAIRSKEPAALEAASKPTEGAVDTAKPATAPADGSRTTSLAATPVDSVPTAPAVSDPSATGGTGNETNVTSGTSSANGTNAPGPTDASTPVSASVDPASPAVKETQDKITSMQQLFEQRKQMISTQANTPQQ